MAVAWRDRDNNIEADSRFCRCWSRYETASLCDDDLLKLTRFGWFFLDAFDDECEPIDDGVNRSSSSAAAPESWFTSCFTIPSIADVVLQSRCWFWTSSAFWMWFGFGKVFILWIGFCLCMWFCVLFLKLALHCMANA